MALTSITLSNSNNMQITLLNWGARLVSVKVPVNGELTEACLCYASYEDYLTDPRFIGSIAGRVANRIRAGKTTLNGQALQLSVNRPPHHLHGGETGFDKKFWQVMSQSATSVTFKHISPDGDMGYPGELSIEVTYTLTDDNEIKISYQGSTTKTTLVNLTNHSYFTLGATGTIEGLEYMVDADSFTAVDKDTVTTGEIIDVTDTPMDLRQLSNIKERIDADYEQIQNGGGFDHNYVLNSPALDKLSAKVVNPENGLSIEVYTTQPGVQFYSGNNIKEDLPYRSGFCLETQGFPNSPNFEHFPSVQLNPEDTYQHTCMYKFVVEK